MFARNLNLMQAIVYYYSNIPPLWTTGGAYTADTNFTTSWEPSLDFGRRYKPKELFNLSCSVIIKIFNQPEPTWSSTLYAYGNNYTSQVEFKLDVQLGPS